MFQHMDPSVLWAGAYPADVARLLVAQYRAMNVIRIAPPEDVVFLVSDGCPVPLAVLRDESEWRVDPEPLVRMRLDAKGRN
jgi:hypothetical protein